MKSLKFATLIGTFLCGLGVGCGDLGALDIGVAGSDVAREQLALADGDGAGADDHAGRCGRSELARIESQLGLSADQITQVQAILTATRQALKDLRAEVTAGTLTREDARTKAHALHQAEKDQIMALLTPDQQAQFATLRDHHDRPFDLDRLATALGLSDDQKTQITDVMNATRTQRDDVHAQVEAGALTREDAHARLDQLRKDEEAAIKAVLTPEQQATLATLREHQGHRGGHR